MTDTPPFCDTNEVILPASGIGYNARPYPGSYCTRTCYADDQCGTGRCGIFGGLWGEARSVCYSTCAVFTDCRPGYDCVTYDNGPGICVVSNLPDGGTDTLYDAGPGPARTTTGKACTQDSDCQGTSKYGRCIAGKLPDGGSNGFGTGYCTADCTMAPVDAWCMGLNELTPSDGGDLCLPLLGADPAGDPIVLWQCAEGCANGGSCRSGYHCQATANGSYCQVNCDAAGASNDCPAGECLTIAGCVIQSTCNAATHDCQ